MLILGMKPFVAAGHLTYNEVDETNGGMNDETRGGCADGDLYPRFPESG